MKYRLYPALLFSFLLVACSSGNDNLQKDPKEWASALTCEPDFQRFTNEFLSICYPNKWLIDDSGVFGSEVMFTRGVPDSVALGRTFTQNVNVMKQADSNLVSLGINNLDEFAKFSKEQIEKALFESDILSYEKCKLGKIHAYHNQMIANQNGMDLFFDQYMVHKDDFYFIITFTAPIDVSEKDKKFAQRIMNTIRFR